jgi:ribosomal protein S18 acetylase RimI-like enzyme
MIVIRKIATREEIETCAQMMANSEPWITLGRDYEASIETLSVSTKEVYIGLIDREIVGFIILNMQGAFIGYLQTVCISSKWRGKGLGSKLIGYAEKRILRETPNVFICVSSFNKRAIRLYERLGYEEIGELKDYIVTGHSEILLRKTTGPLNEESNKSHNISGS